MDDAPKPPLSARAEEMQPVRVRCLKCEALLQARQTLIAVFNPMTSNAPRDIVAAAAG